MQYALAVDFGLVVQGRRLPGLVLGLDEGVLAKRHALPDANRRAGLGGSPPAGRPLEQGPETSTAALQEARGGPLEDARLLALLEEVRRYRGRLDYAVPADHRGARPGVVGTRSYGLLPGRRSRTTAGARLRLLAGGCYGTTISRRSAPAAGRSRVSCSAS